jgi:hypothetical protein
MSGIPTSSGGDAFLAGGETEADPQVFTGFNNFTEDTHFDENIDADDTLTLNGSSAQFRIAGLSMTSGDSAAGSGGNKLDQLNAGFYGNSIYQLSGPVAPLAPAWFGCVFHQTGVNDIIRTEGKAQMATAPTVGEDLCNKTYVDAAAGGTFVGMRAYLTSPSGTQATPFIFGGNSYCSPATLYNNTTGYFTIPSDGKYFFSIRLNWINASSGNPAYMNLNLTRSSPSYAGLARALKSISSTYLPYGYIYLADNFDLTAGDVLMYNTSLPGAFTQYLTGSFESVITCEKIA